MYMYMKKCVESGPVVPIQEIWLRSMLNKVPSFLQRTSHQKQHIGSLFDEVKTDFTASMKKSMGESLLSYNPSLLL